MSYKEFCNWLTENNINISITDTNAPNDTMQFSTDGKWFLNARYNKNTDFEEVKEAILLELNNIDPMTLLDVMTTTEIAQLLNKDTSTIRKAIDKAISNGVLVEGKDCRKSNQTWLVKKISVKKLYKDISWVEINKLKNKINTLSLNENGLMNILSNIKEIIYSENSIENKYNKIKDIIDSTFK